MVNVLFSLYYCKISVCFQFVTITSSCIEIYLNLKKTRHRTNTQEAHDKIS